MIDRLKTSLKVLTAGVGLVGLGVAAAPTALADEDMSRDRGPDVVEDSGDPEAASGGDERIWFPRIFAAGDSDDGSDGRFRFRNIVPSDSDDGSDERSDQRRLGWLN
ncbi:MAG: hypothetical protein K0U70_03075 [Actinomycetia bacterium]|nr:hypothetical protein [Actinomycetes bacterium]MCH9766763.1 hypothetical protein [Actinomycetes bacterium]